MATANTDEQPVDKSRLIVPGRTVMVRRGSTVTPTKTAHRHHARLRPCGRLRMQSCNAFLEQPSIRRSSKPELSNKERDERDSLRRRQALKELHWHGKPVPKPLPCVRPTCPRSQPYFRSQDPVDPVVKNCIYDLHMAQRGHLTEEQVLAMAEVKALPNNVVCARQGQRSKVMERFFTTRQNKHKEAVEEMKMELLEIAGVMEVLVVDVSRDALAKVHQATNTMNALVPLPPTDNSELLKWTWQELHDAMEKLSSLHQPRKENVQASITQLYNIENKRMEKIEEILDKYYSKLAGINHLREEEVRALIQEQKTTLSLGLVNNQRSIADLEYHLQLYQCQIEQDRLQRWQQAVAHWKILSMENYTTKLCEALEAGWDPPERDEIFQAMVEDVARINAKRKELLDSLVHVSPHNSDRVKIQITVDDLGQLQKEVLVAVQGNFCKMHTALQESARSTLTKMQALHHQVEEEQRMPKERADVILVESIRSGLIPLIKEFETQLEWLENSFKSRNVEMMKQQSILIKYLQGCGHLWELHTISLQHCERELREELGELENIFTSERKKLDAQYAALMVKARQESVVEALPVDFTVAQSVLEAIRIRNKNYRDDQLAILPHYSKFVSQEVDRYDRAVRNFFLVDRTQPSKVEVLPLGGKRPNTSLSKRNSSGRYTASSASSKHHKRGTETVCYESVGELRTDRGTVYFVLKKVDPEQAAKENASTDSVLAHGSERQFCQRPVLSFTSLSQKTGFSAFHHYSGSLGGVTEEDNDDSFPESSKQLIPEGKRASVIPEEWCDWSQCFDIPDADFTAIQDKIRLNFLNHLDTLPDESAANAEAYLRIRVDMLHCAHDLHAHVHTIREKELEDVIETRREELVLHERRLAQHVEAMREVAAEIKCKRKVMKDLQKATTSKYKQKLDTVAVQIREATTKLDVCLVQRKVHALVDETMAEIRKSLVEYASFVDSELVRIRTANLWFYEHIKSFKDGGNFSTEEKTSYMKTLDQEAKQVDALELKLRGDSATVEIKSLEEMTKAAVEFEEKTEDVYLTMALNVAVKYTKQDVWRQMRFLQVESNLQSNAIDRHIKSLKERKSKGALFTLPSFLRDVFKAIRERCQYLDCLPEEKEALKPGVKSSPEPPATSNGQQQSLDTTDQSSERGKRSLGSLESSQSPAGPSAQKSEGSMARARGSQTRGSAQRDSGGLPSHNVPASTGAELPDEVFASIPKEFWYIREHLYEKASKVRLDVPDLSLQTAPLPKDYMVDEATQTALTVFAKVRSECTISDNLEIVTKEKEFVNPYPDYTFLGKMGLLLRKIFALLMHRVKLHFAVNLPAANIDVKQPARGSLKPNQKDAYIREECQRTIDHLEKWFIDMYEEAHLTRLTEISGLVTQLKELEREASEVPEQHVVRLFEKHSKSLVKATTSVEKQYVSLFDALLRQWTTTIKELKEAPRPPSGSSVKEEGENLHVPGSKPSHPERKKSGCHDSKVTIATSAMTLEVASLLNNLGPAFQEAITNCNSALVSALDKKITGYLALYDMLIVDDDVEHLKLGKFKLCDLLRRLRDYKPLTNAEEVAMRRLQRKGSVWPRITLKDLVPPDTSQELLEKQQQVNISKTWLAFTSEGRNRKRGSDTKTVGRLWKILQAKKDKVADKTAPDDAKKATKTFWKEALSKVAALPVLTTGKPPSPSPPPLTVVEERRGSRKSSSAETRRSSLKKDGKGDVSARKLSVSYASDVGTVNMLEGRVSIGSEPKRPGRVSAETYVTGQSPKDNFVHLIRSYRESIARGFFSIAPPVAPVAPARQRRSQVLDKFYASGRTTQCHTRLFDTVEQQFGRYKEASLNARKATERFVTMADLAALRFARAWDNDEVKDMHLFDLFEDPRR